MTAPEPKTAEEILRKEGDADTPELPLNAPPPAYTVQVNIIDNEANAVIGSATSSHVHRPMLDDNGVYAEMLAGLGGTAYVRAFVGEPG